MGEAEASHVRETPMGAPSGIWMGLRGVRLVGGRGLSSERDGNGIPSSPEEGACPGYIPRGMREPHLESRGASFGPRIVIPQLCDLNQAFSEFHLYKLRVIVFAFPAYIAKLW